MFSKVQIHNFNSKAYGMEKYKCQVKKLDHFLLELSVKIKPDEYTIQESAKYAQKVSKCFKMISYSIHKREPPM